MRIRRAIITFIAMIVVLIFGDGVCARGNAAAYELAAIDATLADCAVLVRHKHIRAEVNRIRGIVNIHNMTNREKLDACSDVARVIRANYVLNFEPLFRLIKIERRAYRKL